MIRFVAKLLSTGGALGAAAAPSGHTIGALAEAQHYRVTPGVDSARHVSLVTAAFMLAPADPDATRPRISDDPMEVARFAVQLLGDAKQSANPVRRHFLARDIDLLDAPDLRPFDDDIREIVLATDVRPEPRDRILEAPYRRDERYDFWPAEWDEEVRAAVGAWRGEGPPRISWCKVMIDARFTEHLRIPLPVFGTRANMRR